MNRLLLKIWKVLRLMRGPDVVPGQVWSHVYQPNEFAVPEVHTFEVLEVKGADARGIARDHEGNEKTTVHSHEWLRMLYTLNP